MSNVIRFGSYELDLVAGQLRKNGTRINLRDQSIQVLSSLLERPGEVISRDELRRRIWRDDVFVDFDNSLNTAVARLREALCDNAQHPRFVETLTRRGYRFIGDVEAAGRPLAHQTGQKPRMLVLPCLNFSGDCAQDYLCDAITDEIITALAMLAPEHLSVIARTTAMHYKGRQDDVGEIARELNIDYVVEGAIVRADRQVGINIQLIETREQSHIFAEKYLSDIRYVLSLDDQIARDIMRHIPSIGKSESAASPVHTRGRKPIHDMSAYKAYIEGRAEFLKWSPDGLARAKQLFEVALERDPEFALPYDALAELCWYAAFWGYARPKEMDLIGRGYALRAIEQDESLAETHALLCFLPKRHWCDWMDGYPHIARAKEMSPNSPAVMLRYAMTMMVVGSVEDATEELERALTIDPRSFQIGGWLAEMYYLGRQYQKALAQAMRTFELAPDHFVVHLAMSHIRMATGEYDESIAAARKAVELSGGLPLVRGWLGMALAAAGRKQEAHDMLARLHAIKREKYVPASSFAWIHLALENIDDAFEWLNRAVDEGDRMVAPVRHYPFLDRFRKDPRLQKLLQKMNLEE